MSVPAIRYVQWPVVQAIVGSDIPYDELPTDSNVYYQETGAHLGGMSMGGYKLVTAGMIRFIDKLQHRKKEAEYKVAIKKLTRQQKKSNARYDQLAMQYEQLLTSYNVMKKAYKAETATTKALKKQLDDLLGMLNDTR